MKFKILTLSLSFVISGVALAQDNTNRAEINLHNKDVATSEYEAFKNGTSSDPLEDVRRGYTSSYSNELQNGVLDEKLTLQEQILASENDRLNSVMEDINLNKDNDRRSIYQNAKSEDGNFDYEAFSSSYNDYLTSSKGDVLEAIGDRNSFANDVIDRTSQVTRGVGDTHSYNASVAAQNIIEIIDADRENYANSVKDRLNEAIDNTKERVPVGVEALELAYIFDGDCGETCDFPPPIEDQDPECKYDDDNYIYESESDHSEYGIWSENSRDIDYVYNGVRVYSYSYESTDRSGEWVTIRDDESGAKDGFSIGRVMRSYGGGSNYGTSETTFSEICVDP